MDKIDEEKMKGAYLQRIALAESISRKIREGMPLTAEEVGYVCGVLCDPLDEFCVREGTYRLVEMHNMPVEQANELEDAAACVIRDVIDYSETLYDDIDRDLETMILEKTQGKADA